MANPRLDAVLDAFERLPDLAGRFQHPQRLDPTGGSGQFSLVLTATDDQTGKKVAIKVLDVLRNPEPYRVECFHREPRMLDQLSDRPDVVDLVTPEASVALALTIGGGAPFPIVFPYYVMELASGSLDEAIVGSILTVEERLSVFRSVAYAVSRLHQRDATHRDIKPANVLFFQRGRVKLGDFGTARFMTDPPLLAAYGVFAPGEKTYTPPELFAGLQDDDQSLYRAADMFALGGTLYELFTGTPLGLHLYEPGFVDLFNQTMAAVAPADRRRVFEGAIQSIADARPIPSLRVTGSNVPGSICPHLDGLIQDMCRLDYRTRITDFSSVLRRIDICLLVVRNERLERERRLRRKVRRPRAMIGGKLS